MSSVVRCLVAFCVVAIVVVTPLLAQRPQPGRPGQPGNNQAQNQKGNNGKGKQQQPDVVKITDKRVIEAHEQFIAQLEKLAAEFEKKNDFENARSCYSQIVRLVPQYTPAKEKLDSVRAKESVAEKKRVDVWANKGWQDSGVVVGEGKPVTIRAAEGTWTIKMKYDITADGIEIPKELQNFNIGSLVGAIVTDPSAIPKAGNPDADSQPAGGNANQTADNPVFMIGSKSSFIANKTGKLFLRMYDADEADNVGKLSVEIEGSFEKPGK